jgi:predicted kinase
LPDTGTWEQIFNESYEQTKQALMDEKNVLYDSTNQTVASRNKLREIADSVDSDTKVLFVRSPIETVWQRWSENQKNLSRSVVSKDLVQQTIHMFEEPTEEENVIMVDN